MDAKYVSLIRIELDMRYDGFDWNDLSKIIVKRN